LVGFQDGGVPCYHAILPNLGEKVHCPMATVRRTRRKTEKAATSATIVRLRGRASAGKDVVQSLAGAVHRELRAKHAAGVPYSTLNAQGEVVFVHPDGTIRTGRTGDSPAVS
jgi:hypothetical protein